MKRRNDNRRVSSRGVTLPVLTRRRPDAPTAPPARTEDITRTLLRPQRTDMDKDLLLRKCARPMAGLVWHTCDWRWGDYEVTWKVRDFNYLILESTFGNGAILYAQLWSEPLEDVLFEVCSGNSNPGAKRFIGGDTRDRLRAMGFTIGGEAGNFQKEVTVGSPADAELVAREMLSVFTTPPRSDAG